MALHLTHPSALSHALGVFTLAIGLVFTPVAAHANAEDDGFVMNKSGKRFYALPPAGSTEANLMGARVVQPGKPVAETASVHGNFIRIDRANTTGPRRIAPRAETKMDAGKADAATLSLFDTDAARQGYNKRLVTHRWPLASTIPQHISSGYGMRNDPFHGERRFHGGLDIAAPLGTSVLASADGRVKETGYRQGFGNFVTLSHADGSETMYNHLQKSTVEAGNLVRIGQEIGKLGSTGRSTGPHLDYRLRVAGQKVDPMTVLAGKEPANLGKTPTQLASNARPAAASPNVRNERGVRIITPRERLAMSGGFIQVR